MTSGWNFVYAERYVIHIKMDTSIIGDKLSDSPKIIKKPPVTFCVLCTSQCVTPDTLAEPVD